LVTVREKLAASPFSLFLMVDILAHEGEHEVHALRSPHIFADGKWLHYSPSRFGPKTHEDWLEKPAYVKSADVALRVAAAVIRQRHGGQLAPIAGTPEGRFWAQHAPRIIPVLGRFDEAYAETGDEEFARRQALGTVIAYFNRIQAPYYRAQYDFKRPVARWDSAGSI
jgi:hypothetical protein